ncbi:MULTISPECIES: Na+/H+ antiporter subunit E [Nitrincola]|uniref:Putative monovalent cation/H+ antiporter subunit E n=1 Tax=Nitrincola nitratireducens TaxID=1229521 RepID=W9UZH4_9GAMM|nr:MULTISPECIES: Na+/H+ antiporter subunit E [Nitrincola]EXJ10111.1 putative monovalent cation/H+ antiporter subunit E [Nitrincola nitratireducens]
MMNHLARGFTPSSFIVRSLVGGLFWWIISEGDASSWMIGLPSVLICSLVSLRVYPPSPYRIHPLGLLRFAGYFLYASLIAGIDIARRTLDRRLPVCSCMTDFTTQLTGLPLWLFMITMSLLPGTLSVRTTQKGLKIHCLDTPDKIQPELLRLENHIARAFSLTQPPH